MGEQEYSLRYSRDRNWLSNDTTFDYNFKVSNPDNLGVLNKTYNKVKSIERDTLILPNFLLILRKCCVPKHPDYY